MEFYTNVTTRGNDVLIRGINKDGQRFNDRIHWSPTLYTRSFLESDITTVLGEPVEPISFDDMKSARDWQKKMGDDVYGGIPFKYAYITERYPETIEFDPTKVKIQYIDIECSTEHGFPDTENPLAEITAITVSDGKRYFVFGNGKYKKHRDDVIYKDFGSEKELVRAYLKFTAGSQPDVITGWNSKFFDMPYLVARSRKINLNKEVSKISPWGVVKESKEEFRGREYPTVEILGISQVDYMQNYWFNVKKVRENYKLDTIANVELGEKKLDYSEYESLLSLYKDDYQKFIEYNIKDVELVVRLEEKLRLLEMVFTLSYDAKVNYEDTFLQARTWDVILYNSLLKDNMVIPPKKQSNFKGKYAGAYVKQPQVGAHKWVVSFDLTSLYPSMMRQWNMSPDTIVGMYKDANMVDEILDGEGIPDFLRDENQCLAANGALFDNKVEGVISKTLTRMFQDRVEYKKLAKKYEKMYEETNDPEHQKLANRYGNLQLIKKIQLNSCYGAVGNRYFRFFDLRIAEAVTRSGQLVIRWAEKKVNEYLNYMNSTKDVDYVIASDTDSLYINMDKWVENLIGTEFDTDIIVGELDEACDKHIQPLMDKIYEELRELLNCKEQLMHMDREAIADRAIWVAGKNYILNVWDMEGVRYHEPKLKIMGISAIKSSTPEFCRKRIKRCIEILLRGNENELIDYVEETKSLFFDLPNEEIMSPRGVNGLDKYHDPELIYTKGTPLQVRGSLLFNNKLKNSKLDRKYETIQSGDKIKYCYLKMPNPLQDDVIAIKNILPREFGLDDYLDKEKQFQKTFKDGLEPIVEPIGWQMERISSLEDWL